MLAEILHKILKMGEEGRHEYYPRPSSAGPERCERQSVYRRIRQPEDKGFSGRMLSVLADSTWDEEQTLSLIAQSAYQLHSQQMPFSIVGVLDFEKPNETRVCGICSKAAGIQVFVPNQDLHGHLDGIFTDPLGVDRVIEHKALSHFGFERLWNSEELPLDYLTQLAMEIRGAQNVNPALAEGLLFVKNKNTSGFLDYLCAYIPGNDSLLVKCMTRHTGEQVKINKPIQGIVTAAVDKFRRIEQHAKDGTLPDRLPPGGWRCDYCEFNGIPSTCWGNFVEETTAKDTVDLSSVADAAGLASAVTQYVLATADIKTLEIEKETLRDRILSTLRAYQAKKGTLAGFSLSRSVQTREGNVNWQDVPGSVKAALAPFRGSDSVIEVLRVTKKKESA